MACSSPATWSLPPTARPARPPASRSIPSCPQPPPQAAAAAFLPWSARSHQPPPPRPRRTASQGQKPTPVHRDIRHQQRSSTPAARAPSRVDTASTCARSRPPAWVAHPLPNLKHTEQPTSAIPWATTTRPPRHHPRAAPPPHRRLRTTHGARQTTAPPPTLRNSSPQPQADSHAVPVFALIAPPPSRSDLPTAKALPESPACSSRQCSLMKALC